ncbi:hypothetical protein NC653_026315 [Populus alba x Populus x berolinensis]|uniref:Uncharacterized protein n=1 Tax=Populus alba x Populus x berolinensis TaxID=444605 RepID=A0AAD6QAZ9_9ROSI|nr:hypothetical protein NC653_026315 [Populus alba x Populus x berolinensis]
MIYKLLVLICQRFNSPGVEVVIFLWDLLFALFTRASSFSAQHPGHLLLFLQLNPLPVEKASSQGKLYHVCSLLIQQ